ncbi:MAG TPA: hypothetical protein DCQ28_00070 [Bacteroidetes bacterium]|nr:hypothetical protein [Bacteroidota bacterium]
MMRIFFLFLFSLSAIFAQTRTELLSYSVSAAMGERTGEITGIITVQLLVKTDSMEHYTFLVPKEMRINSIYDNGKESLDFERDQTNFSKYAVTIQLPEFVHRNDSLTFSFPFISVFDTSSVATMFVAQKEFLLPCTDSLSWIPNFGTGSALHYSLEAALPSHYTLIADSKFDTSLSDTVRIWKRSSSQPTLLFSAFTFCGISNASIQTVYDIDSLNAIVFVFDQERFNQQYTEALTRQMNDAANYFTILTGRSNEGYHRSYAIIGSEQYNTNIIDTKKFVIHRNSPAYVQFDSTALLSSTENKWLLNEAQYFCPVTTDTTAVFRDGFASYLVARYLASRFPELDKQERFNAIASTLTFFPYGTIAEGRTSKANSTDLFSTKGRYVFLMLEYILGQELLDTVIVKMNERYSSTAISFSGFRQLCEDEYGSSLGWFFDQWLYRTSAPEFVMTWRNEKTTRGMTIVRTIIEQRGDIFSTPMNIAFQIGSRTIQKRIVITQQKQEFTFVFPTPPTRVELDPHYNVLRWLLEIRILAHARSAQLFLSINRDIITAEREALYTVQLDPNNSTGSIPFAYYTLGKIAVLKNDLEKAKEYFLKAMPLSGTRETESYKLWSLIRYANIVEMEGNRDEAKILLQRTVTEGRKNPLIFERTTIEAMKYLRDNFIAHDDIWYGIF